MWDDPNSEQGHSVVHNNKYKYKKTFIVCSLQLAQGNIPQNPHRVMQA